MLRGIPNFAIMGGFFFSLFFPGSCFHLEASEGISLPILGAVWGGGCALTFQPPWCGAGGAGRLRCALLTECPWLRIHRTIVSVCVWGCLWECVFLSVSACQCQAVCVYLCRPVWACSVRQGAGGGVGEREGITEPRFPREGGREAGAHGWLSMLYAQAQGLLCCS